MKATIDRDYWNAFVLKKEGALELDAGLLRLAGKPKYQIECRDGLRREFEDVQEFLAFNNTKSKAIRSLRLIARSTGSKTDAVLKFGVARVPINIQIDGEEKVVSELSEILKDCIDGMTPWYSPISRVDFLAAGFFAVAAEIGITFCLGIYAMFKISTPQPAKPATPHEFAVFFITFSGAVVAPVFGGWLLDLLRRRVFPKAIFALGQGEGRFGTLEKVHWGLLVGFVASLVASIIVYYFPVRH